MRIFRPNVPLPWLDPVLRSIERGLRQPFDAPVMLQRFTVAELPGAANWTGGMVYVSNEVGGAVPAYSDGVSWRRVTDRAIVS